MLREAVRALISHVPRPVRETPPRFDRRAFRRTASRVRDLELRQHALALIDQGYTVVSNAAPAQSIDAAEAEFLAWKARNLERFPLGFFRAPGQLDRIINIHLTLPAFRKLLSQNTAWRVQDYLFGREAAVYSTLFFEAGSAQPLHRDIPLFWTRPAAMYFGMWIAFESTDVANGPLVVVPGSHRLPLLDRRAITREVLAPGVQPRPVDEQLWHAYQTRIVEECDRRGLQTIEVHARRGDTIIWHPLLVHGGAPIRNMTRTRRSLVVHTTPVGTGVWQSDVFFDPDKRVPAAAPWGYANVGTRKMAMVESHLSVGHSHDNFDYSTIT